MLRAISRLSRGRFSLRCLSTQSITAQAQEAATAHIAKASEDAKFPYGQTLVVDNGKRKLEIKVGPKAPAPKTAKLAISVDRVPISPPKFKLWFLGPDGKRAHALFEKAKSSGNFEAISKSLGNFAAYYQDTRSVRINLLSPVQSPDEKYKYLQDLAKQVGCDAATADIIVELFKDKSLHLVGNLKTYFDRLVAEHLNEKVGTIASAEPLTEEQYRAIEARMQKLVSEDTKLIVKREVDPSLLGGFLIRIGALQQDLSVASQISNMEHHLKSFFSSNVNAATKVLSN